MMDKNVRKFVENYMDICCDYCINVKHLENCDSRFSKCLEKAAFVASKMIDEGWISCQHIKVNHTV